MATVSPINSHVNRRLTRAFIRTNPVSLALTPQTRVKKPAGGWVSEPGTPREPQTFSLIEPTVQPRPTVTVDGVERVVEFTLLGEWDAEVERGDVFTHQGREWEIVELFYDNGYERRATVSGRG